MAGQAKGKAPSWYYKNANGSLQNSPATGGQYWQWGSVLGAVLDDAAISDYKSLTGVAGKSVFLRLQSALDSNLAGASLTTTTGAKHGSGTDGSLTWRAGLHYFEPQASAGNTYLTIDSATGLSTEIRFDAGSSITTGFAFSYGGLKSLIMDDADPAEFVASAAVGKPTYLRTQSGADNGAGAGYAGADFEIRTGDGGDGTGAAGGAAGVVRVVCGNGGSGTSSGANGSFQVWHGTEAGTNYISQRCDASNCFLNAGVGDLRFEFAGTSKWTMSTTSFSGLSANTYIIGGTTYELKNICVGEDRTTATAASGTGVFWGLAQEAQLYYNKDRTSYPANCLILGVSNSGTASVDRLALSAGAITGFAALAATAGGSLFASLQTGGTAATFGLAGASGTLTSGAGSAGVAGVGGAGGAWSIVGAAGAAAAGGDFLGGAGGAINLTAGASGASSTGGGAVAGVAGASIILTPGLKGAAAGGGAAAADGVVSINQPGGTPGTDSLYLYDNGTNAVIDARNAKLDLLFAGTRKLDYGITLAGAWVFSSSTDYADGYSAQFGTDQDWKFSYDETTTDALILSEATVGALAIKGSSITGFTAATTVAGNPLYLATQSGLDSNAAGASLYLNLGAAHGSGTGGSLYLTPGGTTSGARGNVTVYQDAIASTSTSTVLISNTTASDDTTKVQMSGRLGFYGSAYRQQAVAASQSHLFYIENLPATAVTGDTTASLKIAYSFNGGAATNPVIISSDNGITMPPGSYINTDSIRPGSNSTFTIQSRSFASADSAIEACTGTWTHSSGTGIAFEIKPTWNASSTASETCLKINSTSTAVGSGAYLLIQALDDAVEKFSVTSAGAGTFAGSCTATSFLVGAAACYYAGGTDVAVADGGTGLSSWAVGDIVHATGATTLAGLADVAVGSVLISGGVGVVPSWSTDLGTAVTIGTQYIYRVAGTDVAVADGGTGLSSYAVGDILHATGTGTIAGLADVAVGAVLVSGGVGVVSAWSTSPSVASATVTPAAGVVGLTCTASAHTGTAGVIDINCTTAGSGVVGFDCAMTAPSAGLGAGDSMFGINVLIVGDDNDNASSGKYAFQGGYVPSGGSGNSYCFYCPDTDFTYGLYNAAANYFGGDTTIATTKAIQTGATDDNYVLFNARDNGTGYKEVARLTGAAEPYLSLVQAKFGTSALAADSAHRGMYYFTEGGAGVADKLYCIMKNSADAYEAVLVATGS